MKNCIKCRSACVSYETDTGVLYKCSNSPCPMSRVSLCKDFWEIVNEPVEYESLTFPPSPTIPKDDVIKKAYKKRVELGLDDGKPLIVRDVAVRAGITINYINREGAENTPELEVYPDERIISNLLIGNPHSRDLFTLARHIGLVDLYIDDFPEYGAYRYFQVGSNRQTWEVSWYSAEFIAPEEQIKRFYRRGFSCRQMAEFFDISETHIGARLMSMGYKNIA